MRLLAGRLSVSRRHCD